VEIAPGELQRGAPLRLIGSQVVERERSAGCTDRAYEVVGDLARVEDVGSKCLVAFKKSSVVRQNNAFALRREAAFGHPR
jgi:hypothetical protein